jgi:hypothetical protein
MKFTIITPSYKNGAFLTELIESAIRQDATSPEERTEKVRRSAGRMGCQLSEAY